MTDLWECTGCTCIHPLELNMQLLLELIDFTILSICKMYNLVQRMDVCRPGWRINQQYDVCCPVDWKICVYEPQMVLELEQHLGSHD